MKTVHAVDALRSAVRPILVLTTSLDSDPTADPADIVDLASLHLARLIAVEEAGPMERGQSNLVHLGQSVLTAAAVLAHYIGTGGRERDTLPDARECHAALDILARDLWNRLDEKEA